MKKTLVVFEEFDRPAKVFILIGDYRHLHGVLINGVESDEEKQQELNDLIYDENGRHRLLAHESTELPQVDFLIVCGFIP